MSLAQVVPYAVLEDGNEEHEHAITKKDKEELVEKLTAAHDGLMVFLYR